MISNYTVPHTKTLSKASLDDSFYLVLIEMVFFFLAKCNITENPGLALTSNFPQILVGVVHAPLITAVWRHRLVDLGSIVSSRTARDAERSCLKKTRQVYPQRPLKGKSLPKKIEEKKEGIQILCGTREIDQ